jgi:hypothetical protein
MSLVGPRLLLMQYLELYSAAGAAVRAARHHRLGATNGPMSREQKFELMYGMSITCRCTM